MPPVRIAAAGREQLLSDLVLPLDPRSLVAATDPPRRWEVEIGFGKGRFLLEQAGANPDRGYLGIEVATKYYRSVRRRADRRECANLVLMRGEARYLLAAVVPASFAEAVHVYFPDPWPKSRHHARRLFDPESLDLILRLLEPGGRLLFATDFLDYGNQVGELLNNHPALSVSQLDGFWGGRARTNYEDKYHREGRPILRFEARLAERDELIYPRARPAILAANAETFELAEAVGR